jgi:Flagellar hook-length control protein FliK
MIVAPTLPDVSPQPDQSPDVPSGDGDFRAALTRCADEQDPRDAGARRAQKKPDSSPELTAALAQLDPTAVAVAELASPGPVKPTQELVRETQTGAGSNGAPASTITRDRPPATAGDASAPAEPGPTQPQNSHSAQDVDEHGAPGPRTKEPTTPSAQAAKPEGSRQVREPATMRSGPVVGAQPAVAAESGAQPKPNPGNAAAGKVTAPVAIRGVAAASQTNGSRIGPRGLAGAPPPRFTLKGDDEKFSAQLSRGLAAALRQKGGTVTLRLQPEALGDLKIRMALEPGKVAARFEVSTDQARELLGRTMDSLRTALEARGLAVDRLEVQVARGVETPSGQHFGGAETGPGWTGDERAGSEHPGKDAGESWRAGMPREPATAEPIDHGWSVPWMGDQAGGALRLDALA